MICITGATGFIGSNFIRYLNRKNYKNLILIDYFSKEKNKNIEGCFFEKKIDLNKTSNINLSLIRGVNLVVHLGAVTDTMCKDIDLIHRNNFLSSKKIFQFCKKNKIKFVYASSASVYGKNTSFSEIPKYEAPINLYAYSKKLFDDYIREFTNNFKNNDFPIYGLRFFNVYGPNESHKKNMTSPIYSFYKQALKNRSINLFNGRSFLNYKKISRDFIYINDVCEIMYKVINLNKDISGIYNLGTGNDNTFYNVANEIKKYLYNKTKLSIKIKKISFPDNLIDGYQHYTKSNPVNLRKLIGKYKFTTLEDGINQYLRILEEK